jgi:transketolase
MSQLEFEPRRLRRTVLDMAFAGSTVHIGCAFSLIEILAVLYRSFLRYPENDPNATGRDYLVLSKGHGVMAQYACMRELGWLGDDDVANYFGDGTQLKGLSDSRIPGLEVTSGTLGHGLSVAVGLALAAKLRNSKQKTYAIVGDGEVDEGPIWEAILFATHYKLSDLLIVIDKNGFQAMGTTSEVMELGDLATKFSAFGLVTESVAGHDEAALTAALRRLSMADSEKPKALIANTVKGKGVSFMENNNLWHYTRLTPPLYKRALVELGFV